MATSSRHHSHPIRTLIIFAVFIGALYVLMAVAGAWNPKLGLDLSGGTTITLTAKNSTGKGTVDPASMTIAQGILENRVNSLGVSQAQVTISGSNQIIITVPNVQQSDLVKLVGQTGQLYFRQVFQQDQIGASTTTNGSAQQPSTTVTAQATPAAGTNQRPLPQLPTPQPTPRPSVAANPLPTLDTRMKYTPSARDTSDYTNYTSCSTPSPTPDVIDQPLITCDQTGSYKYLLGPALVAGSEVSNAQAAVPSNSVSWLVQLSFNAQGTKDFQTVTDSLVSQTSPQNQFAIVLDSEVISAPVVQSAINGGNAQITGNFNQQSATQLADVLRFGALPLAFDTSTVQTVSATLGGEQLSAGIIAGLIGLALVFIYALIYYRGLAMIVICSLGISGILTYAMLVLLGYSLGLALDLPGIAGVIVAVGVTADSFIIYFERIRDEVREGRSLRTAIETGWVRSRKTIVIADSVSLLSAIVLFILATSDVKGFAFTLGLTTAIDLMIVFWFTKPMLTLLGRTKFFGEGHRFSGFEPEHMGLPRPPLHSSRPRESRPAPAVQGGAS